MRKFLFALIFPLAFIACKESPANSTAAPGGSDTSTAVITMPYVAEYSSNFIPAKQSDVLTVLNSYKAFETGDMKTMRETFGDTVNFGFSDGATLAGPTDSVVKIIGLYRDSLSKIVLTFYAWTPNHSVDKNTDWVNVWYKEVDYYKSGKVDSMDYEDDNMLKNGKIVYLDSHAKKFKKK